ncbi:MULTISPECIES: SDR family NAD(P)-dependent oxidoreductase [Rhodococcus]|uniref:SDR family NAD(P)-dependent oxidoreductase n=1 Tax=Rhodococcus TaxID=1827 RepID=UPI001062E80B|nr:SDR family oxidoreductase [Rhodococcus opacus]MDJ0418518.1 SDR family oxidoreductase [Rhodococcus opacus]NHU47760.1 SDR family oxidoreductase [Rhodococcus sp. A14]UZG52847.1 SDR family oxidoreductase [Rhodococcus opacus]
MPASGLEDKVAIVTGAAGGLGQAAAQRLSEEGVKVVAVDLDAEAAQKSAADLPGEAIAVGSDVSSEEGVEHYMAEAVKAFGTVDFHFLNAGIAGSLAELVDVPVNEWDKVMAVNLRGPFLGIRAAFRQYLAEGTTGSIVVTSSIAGLRGSNDLLAYTTSKHGVVGLVHGAAVYGGPIGVRVNGIAPGIVPTTIFGASGQADMIRRAGTSPLRRPGTPEEIAGSVAFLLSDDATYITGEILSIDGGANVQNANRNAGGAGLWDVSITDETILRRHRDEHTNTARR